jgi:hypothetical protein
MGQTVDGRWKQSRKRGATATAKEGSAMGYIVAWALGVPVTVLVVWFLIKNVL